MQVRNPIPSATQPETWRKRKLVCSCVYEQNSGWEALSRCTSRCIPNPVKTEIIIFTGSSRSTKQCFTPVSMTQLNLQNGQDLALVWENKSKRSKRFRMPSQKKLNPSPLPLTKFNYLEGMKKKAWDGFGSLLLGPIVSSPSVNYWKTNIAGALGSPVVPHALHSSNLQLIAMLSSACFPNSLKRVPGPKCARELFKIGGLKSKQIEA